MNRIMAFLATVGSLLLAVFFYKGKAHKAEKNLSELNETAATAQKDQIVKANQASSDAFTEAKKAADRREKDALDKDINPFSSDW